MEAALLLILIIIANLTLYWLFFGKKKFEEKLEVNKALESDKSKY